MESREAVTSRQTSALDEYLEHLEGDYEVQVEAKRLGLSVAEYVQLVRDKYASLHRTVP